MPTLLIRLVGPMQSWGTGSEFDKRETDKEPSKSGVIGLLAAAMGIDRENWTDLEPLTRLSMGVRHDRSGRLMKDFQTAGGAESETIIKADGSQEKKNGVISRRFYLADAAFLVGLEDKKSELLQQLLVALHNPVWPLALGRKSYVPSEPVFIEDGLLDLPLVDALRAWPWISKARYRESAPEEFLVSLESEDGSGALRMDQPLASFAERVFGARYVRSEFMSCSQGVQSVSE